MADGADAVAEVDVLADSVEAVVEAVEGAADEQSKNIQSPVTRTHEKPYRRNALVRLKKPTVISPKGHRLGLWSSRPHIRPSAARSNTIRMSTNNYKLQTKTGAARSILKT